MEKSLIGSYNFNVLRSILEGLNLLHRQTGVEVGVLDGGTSLFLLQSFPLLRLVSVDSYRIYNEYDAPRLREAEARAAQRLSGFGDRSIRVKEDSVTASKLLSDNSFDFVFIDADHTYEAVTQDIAAWYSKVRPGGLFCGHDYCWEGVGLAVNEFSKAQRISGYFTPPESDIWWFIKPA